MRSELTPSRKPRSKWPTGNTTVVLTFSEPLSPGSEDPRNFIIRCFDPFTSTACPNLAITGTMLTTLGTQIVLTTLPQAPGMQYTVDTGSGNIMIVSDQSEIAVGDCVAVENAGTGAANIRRASSALCESPEPLTAATEENLQEEAADCLAAKDAVLAADTDEDVAAAIRAARIACDS